MTDDDDPRGGPGRGWTAEAGRHDRAFEDSAIGMAIESLDGRFLEVNPALCVLVGYGKDQLLSMGYTDICHPEDLEGAEHLASLANGSTRTVVRELRYIRSDGKEIWVRVHVGVIRNRDGVPSCYAAQIEDITQRHRAEQRFRRAFDDAAVGMALIEVGAGDGTIVEANAMTSRLLGRDMSELIGATISAFVHPDDVAAVSRLFDDLASGERRQSEASVRFLARRGTLVWAHLSASAPRGPGDRSSFFVLHLQDITARKAAEEKLVHLANHDSLTGLPNRHAFTRQLKAMAASPDPAGADRRALLFIDLDRFKLVNDSLGHTICDELLISVAGRLRSAVAGGDLVARIGGDEFVVLARSTPTIEAAQRLADRVLRALEAPFRIAGRLLYLTASVGIALTEQDGLPDDLLPAADLAMHDAKGAGKARTVVFQSSMRHQAEDRLATEQGLYRALQGGELVLWYQSVVSLVTRRPVAAEALLRWHHPEAGLLEPAAFLPVAEETGLIVPIGRYVLSQALNQVRHWRDQNIGLTVNVNLAGAQLDAPGLVAEIEGMLQARQLLPHDLCLEVSESAIRHPGSRAAGNVSELRRLGVSVAIDDFGLGNSSLAYLRSEPVDVVKIDTSFATTLDGNPRDSAIVGAVIQLVHALGMGCIALGVETTAELSHLTELGCDQVQGHVTGRAQPEGPWLEQVVADELSRGTLLPDGEAGVAG
jgi:diguanylate cyclase (GGDEF)-like protein/PAS domain S-box-containing protein